MVVQSHHISQAEIVSTVDLAFSQERKRLPSWMLYDAEGDKLFQKIMTLPEYYPTRCEAEIIMHYQEDFSRYFLERGNIFNLVELGAGDGIKTEVLLRALLHSHIKFTYTPVDISNSILQQLKSRLQIHYPSLTIETRNISYDDAIAALDKNTRSVILFLGANIGNMTQHDATAFLGRTADGMAKDDLAVIGFDLKKDPRVIEAAYDDSEGVTREFNLNVLRRINRDAGARFDVAQFDHYPSYDPETGTASSYLVSLKDQDVFVGSLNKTFHFSQWESIHMEISQKYDLLQIEKMLTESGLEIVDLFFDRNHYFCDVIVSKKR